MGATLASGGEPELDVSPSGFGRVFSTIVQIDHVNCAIIGPNRCEVFGRSCASNSQSSGSDNQRI